MVGSGSELQKHQHEAISMFFSALKRRHKEAIGLLQIGTLLEYFDLMLYVHMSFLLNDFFFPKTDPHTSALLTAFAFCSTYVLRPLGGFFFGFIGDHIGRKMTVIISSMMMGLSCILMANLPSYDQIGITAAYGVTLCRILQGLACQGEIIGAEIYLIEITKPPLRYPVVALCSFFASLGGMMALGLSILLLLLKIDWRLAFWVGAGISSIGFLARTHLRETPEFLRIRRQKQQSNKLFKTKAAPKDPQANIHRWSMVAYFLISCGYPMCFYLAYMHLGTHLKNNYGYTSQDLIQHNFILSLVQCLSFLFYAILSYRINPLKILRYRWFAFLPLMLLYPYWLGLLETPAQVLIFQILILVLGVMDVPAAGLMINYFAVLKRFMSAGLIYAFSRMAIYVLTSFGMVYLTGALSHWGVWWIMLFICLGFDGSIGYFAQLEHLKDPGLFSAILKLRGKLNRYLPQRSKAT